jgi:hypothetical protein
MVCTHKVGLIGRGGDGHIDTLTDIEIVGVCGQLADIVCVLPVVCVISFLGNGSVFEV